MKPNNKSISSVWDLTLLPWCCWRFRSPRMWHRIIRREIPGILKDCFAFKTSGTTHPKTQFHIPQDKKIL